VSQFAGSTTGCFRAATSGRRRGPVKQAFQLQTSRLRLSGAGPTGRRAAARARVHAARPHEFPKPLPLAALGRECASLLRPRHGEQVARLGRERIERVLEISCSKSGAAPCEGSRVGLSLAEEPLDAQDLQRPLEQHHLPREVFFFGLAFAGGFVPAAAARAFCFFVANLSLLGSLGPVRPMLLPVPAFEPVGSASCTRQSGSCWPVVANAGLARVSSESTLAQAT
jgi:hypothetical protein